jgi:hypothetical protein
MKSHEKMEKTPEEMAEKNPAILRKVEVKTQEGWIEVRLKDLVDKDIFKFKTPNEPYLDDKEWIAEGKPFVNEYYVWSIRGRPVHTIPNVLQEGY